MAQIMDIDSAREFMKEAMGKISVAELYRICQDMEVKSRYFQETLAPQRLPDLDEKALYSLLRQIFSVRRKARRLIETHGAEHLVAWMNDLLYGSGEVHQRLERFCGQVTAVEETLRFDLGSELLHFTHPEQHWLWTRWIWDPRNKTGALPLVLVEEYDLEAGGIGATYLRLGEALSFVRHVGEAAGFEVIGEGPFGVDAFLACVYVIYVYTVLRLRMTQEFNKVMPGLAEFSRRLLGVYNTEEQQHAGG